ncbi:MAG: type II toxin-antitoxin system HicA family toxin [Bacteroidales bacterium]|nr:type II toxin-antitoxin system HicA family toxin [Bacteroidales bacterium]
MKIVERRSLIKELTGSGYKYVRQTGSHEIYKNNENTIAVPIHLNPCIAIRLQKEIRKEKSK